MIVLVVLWFRFGPWSHGSSIKGLGVPALVDRSVGFLPVSFSVKLHFQSKHEKSSKELAGEAEALRCAVWDHSFTRMSSISLMIITMVKEIITMYWFDGYACCL